MTSSENKFDLVVFGATGFTGARVLQRACEQHPSWRIAAAGRSQTKLEQVCAAHGATSATVLSGVDITKPDTLVAMAAAARVVLSCVGPYRRYGEPVVKACVDTGTDYLDVSGEPEFMERMQVRYHDAAKSAGCFIVSAAAFDCVPAEVGAALCCDSLAEDGQTPHHIDSRLTLDWGKAGAAAHFGTFESAVLGIGDPASLGSVRKEARQKGLNPPPQVPGPKARKPPPLQWRPDWQAWALPFMGADAAVVRRSMSARSAAGKPAAHYTASFTIASRLNLALFMLFGNLFMLLARFAFGRKLLLRYPALFTLGAFSHEGPTQEQMQGTSFVMTHEGFAVDASSGQVQDKPSVRVSVAGPEPGYVATPILVVAAAAELLDKRAQIADTVGRGGVLTPGQLLLLHSKSSFVDRLRAGGVSVTVNRLQPVPLVQ